MLTMPRGCATTRLIDSEDLGSRHGCDLGLQTFEVEMRTEEETFAELAQLNRALVGEAEALDSRYQTGMDMGWTGTPVYNGISPTCWCARGKDLAVGKDVKVSEKVFRIETLWVCMLFGKSGTSRFGALECNPDRNRAGVALQGAV